MPVELILGGARSGKSRHALTQAHAYGGPVCWVATAQAWDDEMRERIAHHQSERPSHWQTVEEPLQLAAVLTSRPDQFVVVDCLTLWLTNWLCREDQAGWQVARESFLNALQLPRVLPLLLVSNEVGFGIVPDNALARQFRDEAGRLHQDIASLVPRVTLVVAGIPLSVKKEK